MSSKITHTCFSSIKYKGSKEIIWLIAMFIIIILLCFPIVYRLLMQSEAIFNVFMTNVVSQQRHRIFHKNLTQENSKLLKWQSEVGNNYRIRYQVYIPGTAYKQNEQF